MARANVHQLQTQLHQATQNAEYAKRDAEYWKKLYDNQVVSNRNNYTEISNLRTQLAQVKGSLNDLHDHHQDSLEKLEQAHGEAIDQYAVLAGNLIRQTEQKARDTVDKVIVEDTITMAELKGQRDAMGLAFRYLADRVTT